VEEAGIEPAALDVKPLAAHQGLPPCGNRPPVPTLTRRYGGFAFISVGLTPLAVLRLTTRSARRSRMKAS